MIQIDKLDVLSTSATQVAQALQQNPKQGVSQPDLAVAIRKQIVDGVMDGLGPAFLSISAKKLLFVCCLLCHPDPV